MPTTAVPGLPRGDDVAPRGCGFGASPRSTGVDAAAARSEKAQDPSKDEHHAENQREKYRFLIHRLRSDVRFLFHSLPEFADLPQEALAEMEGQLTSLVSANAGEGDTIGLEAVVALLNHRDRAISYLCEALLFQKALLNWELKQQGPAAAAAAVAATEGDGASLAEFSEQIRKHVAKDGSLPEKLAVADLSAATDPGHFTYDKAKARRDASGNQGGAGLQAAGSGENEAPSQLQSRLMGFLREMQSLDKAIRHVKFGEKVTIPAKNRPDGRIIGSDEIRNEITRWYDRCMRLELELQTRKAQRHTSWEVQVDFYRARSQEKDQQNLAYKSRVLKLEQDVNNFAQEFANLRREKAELAERNEKMVSENLPVVDRIDAQRDKLCEKVDQLRADAEMLSSMFKLQVEENQKTVTERDKMSKELAKARKQLKSARENDTYKDHELQKKEKLHRLTVEAREVAHKEYLQQKTQVKEVQERMRQQEGEWQEKLQELQRRDDTIRTLNEELQRSQQEIDTLEQQKKHCLQEFQSITGRSYSMLLEQFKVVPPKEGSLAPSSR